MSSEAATEDPKPAPELKQKPVEGKFLVLSTRNFLSAIGNRLFSKSKESTEIKKAAQAAATEKQSPKDKPKKEEKLLASQKKDMTFRRLRFDDVSENKRKADRDFRRLRARYNTGVGNIMRTWMSLIYCILILRMNLIKFILEKYPDLESEEFQHQFKSQILLESKTIYNMIRKAQNFSQDRSLYLWSHFEKLILSRMYLKNALEEMKPKDIPRDWKAASIKLDQLTAELEKAQDLLKTVQRGKLQADTSAKDRLFRLQCLINSKNAEIGHVIEQIAECKKKEAQMRGRIHMNLKSSREIKAKHQTLMNAEKELNNLKTEQMLREKEYADRINALKAQIKERDGQIETERAEAKKLRANLEGFGDFHRESPAVEDA